jgi:hypothetical protein
MLSNSEATKGKGIEIQQSVRHACPSMTFLSTDNIDRLVIKVYIYSIQRRLSSSFFSP